MKKKISIKDQRQHRVRMKLAKRAGRPRLSVFRSNKFMYAQIIDDRKGQTLVSISQKDVEKDFLAKEDDELQNASKGVRIAFAIGKLLADRAKKKKITEVVFDKGRFAYHGKIKGLASGARLGGLQF